MQEEPPTNIDTPQHSWMDVIPIDTKYSIAFWYECYIFAFSLWAFLVPHKYRQLVGYKAGWNEITPKISMSLFDWYAYRCALAWVTHALYWLLYDAVGMKPTSAYALAGIPFGLVSLHAILNEIHKESGCSNRPDIQVLIMVATRLFLLYTNSPHLLLASRITNALTILAGLQLYLAPSLAAWIYGMPSRFAEENVVVFHMNYYGWSVLVMSVLGSALLWLDEDLDSAKAREYMLFALAASWLFSVVSYAPMLPKALVLVTNTNFAFFMLTLALGVGVALMFL